MAEKEENRADFVTLLCSPNELWEHIVFTMFLIIVFRLTTEDFIMILLFLFIIIFSTFFCDRDYSEMI